MGNSVSFTDKVQIVSLPLLLKALEFSLTNETILRKSVSDMNNKAFDLYDMGFGVQRYGFIF